MSGPTAGDGAGAASGRSLLGSSAERTVLMELSRAVAREAPTLSAHPGLLWQQLSNRLRWSTEQVRAIVAGEERRREQAGWTWLRSRTPFHDSRAHLRTLVGHTQPVMGCAVSPDGSAVLSAGADGTLKLWDAASGRELRTLRGHEDRVNACAFSPDGTFAVSCGDDRSIRVWDPVTAEELRTIWGHGDTVWDCAVAPDAAFVVSASADKTVRAWDPRTGRELAVCRAHESSVRCCAIGPDGSWILSGDEDGLLAIWDPATGDQPTIEAHGHPVTDCRIGPDGSVAMSTGTDLRTKRWDTATWRATGEVSEKAWVMCCAISPDGKLAVADTGGDELRALDLDTGRTIAVLRAHVGVISDCRFAPDGSFFVTAGWDNTLKVWDPAALEGEESEEGLGAIPEFQAMIRIAEVGQRGEDGHVAGVMSCAFASDGSLLVTSGADGALHLWDAEAGSHRRALNPGLGWLYDCAVSPDCSMLCAAGHNGLILVALGTGEVIRKLEGHEGAAFGCAFEPGSSFALSAGHDRTLRVWDPATGAELRTLRGHRGGRGDVGQMAGWVTACAVSSDGFFVVSASSDRTLRIWDPATGDHLAALLGHGGMVHGCAVSPDGSFVVSASSDRTLRLWSPTGEELGTLSGHTAPVWACDVTPDGRFVVSGGDDGTVRLWDPFRGSNVATVFLPAAIRGVAAHPTASVVACGDASGGVWLLDLVGTSSLSVGQRIPQPPSSGTRQAASAPGDEHEPGLLDPMYYFLIRTLGLSATEAELARMFDWYRPSGGADPGVQTGEEGP